MSIFAKTSIYVASKEATMNYLQYWLKGYSSNLIFYFLKVGGFVRDRFKKYMTAEAEIS